VSGARRSLFQQRLLPLSLGSTKSAFNTPSSGGNELNYQVAARHNRKTSEVVCGYGLLALKLESIQLLKVSVLVLCACGNTWLVFKYEFRVFGLVLC